MNRQTIEELIHIHVPKLAQEERVRWINVEKLGVDFVFDFPPETIGSLQLDEYVIGKGAENRSFCYRLEREMDDLGRILGATAFKFGVYYGRTKSDPVDKYRFAKRWGSGVEEAFEATKKEIVSLLQAASIKDIDSLDQNPLSKMFKGKLLFVYFPDEYAPIYSQYHLKYFVTELNLHANPNSTIEMQRALMDYRATWPTLMEHSAVLYMHFLYQIFPNVKTPSTSPIIKPALPLLDEAIQGARFINQMPPVSSSTPISSSTTKKPNYENQQKQRKRIGDRGEKIVLRIEEKRLIDEGRADLAEEIKHISEKSDREGYDILSFDQDGSPRYIEVKATTAKNLGRGFYITSNELEKSKALPNYYIYLVFSATSKNPKILPIKQSMLISDDFILHPVAYHVNLNPEEI